jgi:hypothetical protein
VMPLRHEAGDTATGRGGGAEQAQKLWVVGGCSLASEKEAAEGGRIEGWFG